MVSYKFDIDIRTEINPSKFKKIIRRKIKKFSQYYSSNNNYIYHADNDFSICYYDFCKIILHMF